MTKYPRFAQKVENGQNLLIKMTSTNTTKLFLEPLKPSLQSKTSHRKHDI